jgi:hypothetical protein
MKSKIIMLAIAFSSFQAIYAQEVKDSIPSTVDSLEIKKVPVAVVPTAAVALSAAEIKAAEKIKKEEQKLLKDKLNS